MSTHVHWQFHTRWDDPDLDWQGDDRVLTALVDLGDDEDGARPLVAFVRYAPGITVKPHAHASDYCSIVVQGSVEVTRRVHETGSVRFVSAGTVYGPLVAGTEGTTLIDVFTDREGIFPLWVKVEEAERDRLARNEQMLRSRLERLSERPHRGRPG